MSRHPVWTQENALAAGRAFVQSERRRPTQIDTVGGTLPHGNILRILFGSFSAYCAQLPPAPVPPPVRPRHCLQCATLFQPTHRGLYICDPCKTSEAWQEQDAGEWMNGAVSWYAFDQNM